MAVVVDLIEDVFDAVGDAIDWVVNDVIKPVVKGVGDVIEYALDNPIEAIAKVAAIATGNTWAIPLIDGAKVIAEGGNFGDAIKAAAVSYVGGKVGNVAGKYASTALAQAGVSSTVANIVGAGTKSATTALVYGQDPLKAFATGGLQAGVAAGLGWVDTQLKEQYGESFKNLRDGVKDSIFAGLAAELEGGNLSANQMTQIIGKYTGVGKLMNDFLTNNAGFSDAQASILTDAVSSAVSKAIAGNPDLAGEEFFNSISRSGANALKEIIDKPVNKAIDRVSGAYKATETKATALNTAITNASNAADKYNALQSSLADKIAKQDRLQANYDKALATYNENQTEANANKVNAAAEAFNTYATDLEADYNDNYKKQLTYWEGQFNKYNNQIPDLEKDYNKSLEWMVTKTEDLEAKLAPKMSAADRAVALTLRPNFDEAAYREAAGLSANDDVYSHYLENGQNLPTDRVAVDTALDSARFQLVQNALANQGVDWITLEPEQMQAALDYAEKQVKSLNGITGLNFNNFARGATAAANDATPRGAAFPSSYERASGVTDTDIASGNAVLYNNGGTLEWRKTEAIRNDLNGTTVNVSQNRNGTLSGLIETAMQSPDGTATSASGGITIRLPNASGGTTTDNSATLRNIVQQGLDGVIELPEIVVNQLVDLNEEAGRLLDEYVGEPVYEAAKNLYNTYLKDTTAGNALQNTASIITGATGELLQAASGLALLAGANPNNAVGRLADKLLNASANLRTEGYAATADEINQIIGDAEGWRGKAAAIWDVATSGDTAAVFFAEYVGKELIQEIPILLASGGTGNIAKRALQAAGEQTAKRYAARVGVSTAIGLDMAEAFGGTAAGAYDEAYATARRVGMSEQEANDYAIEVGQKAGAIATLMVGVTAGVGGAAFEKAILGDGVQDAAMRGMYDAFKDRLIEGGKITIKEGVTEGIEEALPQAYVAMSLSQIDPTYDVSGEIMAAGLLGKIAGAGTAAGIYTGHSVADALFSSSSDVQNAIKNANNDTAARNALKNLGINDNTVLNNLLNTSYDKLYVSTGEAGTAFKKANPDFEVSDATIESFVGKSSEAAMQTKVDNYIDARYLDIGEVKALAKAEGITLTNAQAEQFVRQGSVAQINNAKKAVSAKYDPQAVTVAEAKAKFKSLGFTPTNAQVNRFVGKFNEASKLKEIAAYVDPRQVTAAEAKKFYADLGYTPTQAEINQFVGQGGANFEKGAPARIETYVDPRQVTDAEARQFFADLGYTPTDKELANFTAQVAETEQQSAIEAYVDPRFVTFDEVQAIANQEGLTLTEALAATYLGQRNEANALKAAQREFDPLATTAAEAKQFFAAQGYTPTTKEIAKFVASKAEAEQRSAIGAYVDPRQVTAKESRAFLEALGYTPTDAEVARFVGQLNDATYQASQESAVGEYVDPRQVTKEEAKQFFEDLGYTPTDSQVNRFVAQVKETTQKDVISKYVDPRQVTMEELQAIAKEEGLTLTEALASAYIGQGTAANYEKQRLTAARAEYDPLATTQDEAAQFFADTGYNATTKEIAKFVASKTEEAQRSAIGSYVDPRQVTAAEAKEFLSSIGYKPTAAEIKQFVGQVNDANFEATRRAEIDEYVDPRYFDAGEVRAAYEELGLVDVTQEDIDRFVGQYDPKSTDYDGAGFEAYQLEQVRGYMPTATFNVIKSILGSPAVEDDPNTEVDESKDATGIYAEFEAGATRDEALQAAIDQLSTELGVTREDVLTQIGLTEEQLSAEIDAVAEDVTAVKEEVTGLGEQITGVETAINERITELEAAGIARDEALSTALSELATDLGTTEANILAELGTTEEALLAEIGGVQATLEETAAATDQDLDFISNLIGKPARDVTQTDVDFVSDLIAQQQVLDELSLEYQQYDVTGDGLLDINDAQLLEQALAGEQVQLSPESAFVTDPTGVYGAMQDVQTDIQEQMEQDKQEQLDAIQDLNTQINTQLQTNQRMSNVSDLRNLLMQQSDISGQRVDVKTPDPMRINYLYDFSSIFATPQQASLFPSPYAKGGQVEDTTDKLLRIIGGTT